MSNESRSHYSAPSTQGRDYVITTTAIHTGHQGEIREAIQSDGPKHSKQGRSRVQHGLDTKPPKRSSLKNYGRSPFTLIIRPTHRQIPLFLFRSTVRIQLQSHARRLTHWFHMPNSTDARPRWSVEVSARMSLSLPATTGWLIGTFLTCFAGGGAD